MSLCEMLKNASRSISVNWLSMNECSSEATGKISENVRSPKSVSETSITLLFSGNGVRLTRLLRSN